MGLKTGQKLWMREKTGQQPSGFNRVQAEFFTLYSSPNTSTPTKV